MTAFFTSDHHFGHKRIIELAKRPFTSVDEMDEYMIVRWNDRVKPGDTIYHVGDFAFTDHDPYLRRLNGQKFLVPGNHDHSNRVKKATGWEGRQDDGYHPPRRDDGGALPLRHARLVALPPRRDPPLRPQPRQPAGRLPELRRRRRLLGFRASFDRGDQGPAGTFAGPGRAGPSPTESNAMTAYDAMLTAMRSKIENNLLQAFALTCTTATAPSGGALTAEEMLASIRQARYASSSRRLYRVSISFLGLCVGDHDRAPVPASKNRSRRIHKKLVKSFGGEFRQKPATYRINDTIYAHPAFRSQLEAKREANRVRLQSAYQNAILQQTWL